MSAQNQTLKKNFYSIREHKFRMYTGKQTDTSKSEQKGEKTYIYEEFNLIQGFLRRLMTWQEELEGKAPFTMFAIDLKDDANEYECLQMYFDGNAATSFLKRLPNIDLTKEIQIKAGKHKFTNKAGEEKVYDRLDVYQKDENNEWKIVPFYWSKDAGRSLPEWKEVTVGTGKNKKTMWDKSEQLEFLEKLMNVKNAEIVDTIKAVQKDGVSFEEVANNKVATEFGNVFNYTQAREKVQNTETQGDDLPF